MPKDPNIHKVLVLGSGPIVIGQAAEFDYAGTQACRALKEEGVEVVLVNSNPATIMTDTDIADKVYLEPLTAGSLEKIIARERPDSLLASLGGQTGLNLAMELDEKGIPYGDVEQGVMIETPAAVMISAQLAREVDFFSLGTNDLTQYTLAIDRQNAKLDNIYDSHHEAVLRMIQMVVDNAHKEGIWAGICGELGADTTLTERFVEMGLDELSVSPTFVLPVRKIVREMK